MIAVRSVADQSNEQADDNGSHHIVPVNSLLGSFGHHHSPPFAPEHIMAAA